MGFPVADDMVAWHAGEHNESYLGIEFTQPFPDTPYAEEHYRAGAALVKRWAEKYGFPLDRDHIFGHDESAQGIRVGKSDPGHMWNWDHFIQLLGEAFPPVETPAGYSREQLIDISNQIADQNGIPRLLMLACAIAESNLIWNARRPKLQSQDRSYWADVSAGVWQQTVRWSEEYRDRGYAAQYGNAYPTDAIVDEILALYLDPWHAGNKAALQLKGYYQKYGDILTALSRYNKPNMEPSQNQNLANYERGIREAKEILGE